jgi:hypothetical protein
VLNIPGTTNQQKVKTISVPTKSTDLILETFKHFPVSGETVPLIRGLVIASHVPGHYILSISTAHVSLDHPNTAEIAFNSISRTPT